MHVLTDLFGASPGMLSRLLIQLAAPQRMVSSVSQVKGPKTPAKRLRGNFG